MPPTHKDVEAVAHVRAEAGGVRGAEAEEEEPECGEEVHGGEQGQQLAAGAQAVGEEAVGERLGGEEGMRKRAGWRGGGHARRGKRRLK